MINSRIKQKDPRAEVILFGSHARGQAIDESDWETRFVYTPLYQNIKQEGIKPSDANTRS
ncbi:MAG: nucleotidyltransferase domain-containing protein [Bacteroidales bacterium]|nr:nucleotidyltransferase domain-containing protein [Bacteroidales bacterium]